MRERSIIFNTKFFIIHNLDKNRKERILSELYKAGVEDKDIIFINHPNKNEITYKIKKIAVQRNTKQGIESKTIKDGWISVTYKHYLALKNIVEDSIPLAFIIEDNVGKINENIYDRISSYLEDLPNDWGVVFESDQFPFSYTKEPVIDKNKVVHQKSNEITYFEDGSTLLMGGTRSAQFYFINLETANRLFDNYLPFNHAPDFWMNELFRKLNIKSFWADPSIIETEKHHRTSTNYKYSDIFYILKSKITNFVLGL
mgnify:FL=1|tara:strand:- start:2076 stop:2846 length:771 start_codon:yes stop_codon:yes gene_type:complete